MPEPLTPPAGTVAEPGTIAGTDDRQLARLTGTVKAVTFRPPSTAPAFEAVLEDGTGTLRVVWVGQHAIAGIGPGRRLAVEGRLRRDAHGATMRDPRYELLPEAIQ
ncbi:MAG: OB-fold nucleic acid binding domain-containing protein [Bifidobacteriaceae bacterium]|nr:OB-fold nucleic acid binding domain-containing protein [Bifidobacteriaceae bacterium]